MQEVSSVLSSFHSDREEVIELVILHINTWLTEIWSHEYIQEANYDNDDNNITIYELCKYVFRYKYFLFIVFQLNI